MPYNFDSQCMYWKVYFETWRGKRFFRKHICLVYVICRVVKFCLSRMRESETFIDLENSGAHATFAIDSTYKAKFSWLESVKTQNVRALESFKIRTYVLCVENAVFYTLHKHMQKTVFSTQNSRLSTLVFWGGYHPARHPPNPPTMR